MKLAGAAIPGAASLRNGLDFALSRSLGLDLAAAKPAPAVAAALAGGDPAEPAEWDVDRHGCRRWPAWRGAMVAGQTLPPGGVSALIAAAAEADAKSRSQGAGAGPAGRRPRPATWLRQDRASLAAFVVPEGKAPAARSLALEDGRAPQADGRDGAAGALDLADAGTAGPSIADRARIVHALALAGLDDGSPRARRWKACWRRNEHSGGAWAEAFLEMMAVERAAAKNTLTAYTRDLADAAGFLAAPRARTWPTPRPRTSRPISPTWAREACRRPRRRGGAPRCGSSIASCWAKAGGATIPRAASRRRRRAGPLPKVLSREEVDRLIAAAGGRDGAQGLRLGCMVELAYASGLRISELTALTAGGAGARSGLSDRQGQGRQGAAGPAERRRARRR